MEASDPTAFGVDCTCGTSGYCVYHGRNVTKTGARIWKTGNTRSIEAYFGNGWRDRAVQDVPIPIAPRDRRTPCVFMGDVITGDDGKPVTRLCPTCRGTVKLKVFECNHSLHAKDPTTTDKACKACPHYTTEIVPLEIGEIQHWRGGI